MTRNLTIAGRLREVLLNGRWIANTNYEEQILSVKPFVDEKYGSYLRNIEAVIEHSYYHLGQISLIGKMINK